MTGILFVWWYLMGKSFFLLWGQPWNYVQPIFWLIVGMLLLVVFIADLRFGLIPDQVNVSLFILALGYRLGLVTTNQMQSLDLVNAVISGLVLTAFFYCLWYFTKGKGFGFGDVKLAPSLGLLLGWPRTLTGMFIAFLIGAICAIFLLIFGKKKFGQTIPFGPFLILGTVAALLWGGQLWSWYWGLI
jgi:leader peptidase (prepilin peptidase)/N-methyltransferase